jgi:hypothetical protein
MKAGDWYYTGSSSSLKSLNIEFWKIEKYFEGGDNATITTFSVYPSRLETKSGIQEVRTIEGLQPALEGHFRRAITVVFGDNK